MRVAEKPISILVADDDPDDRLLIAEALVDTDIAEGIDFVEDGVELLAYLRRQEKFAPLKGRALPALILLDLNMPRKDGREVLDELKSDPVLRRIPVVVLTTSNAEEDIQRTYDLGVSSFIVKPVSFETLVSTMRTVTRYWFDTVSLPEQ